MGDCDSSTSADDVGSADSTAATGGSVARARRHGPAHSVGDDSGVLVLAWISIQGAGLGPLQQFQLRGGRRTALAPEQSQRGREAERQSLLRAADRRKLMQATGASHALYSWCRAQRKRQGDEHGTAVKLLQARDADDWVTGRAARRGRRAVPSLERHWAGPAHDARSRSAASLGAGDWRALSTDE